YRRILTRQPSHADALHLLGVISCQQGDAGTATRLIGRAIELAPTVPEYHNNLGNALLEQERPDEAIACYRAALVLKPAYAEAHQHLGLALKTQGNYAAALESQQTALLLKPDYPEAHLNRGNVYTALAR